MKYDLHIHSKYSSDGVLEPKEIVRVAKEKGLGGIAITDHNTIRGGQEAKQYETKDFKVIVGSEIMTNKGEVIGLFLSKEVKASDIRRVVNEIKQQGGITVVPHPFDRLRRSAFGITAEFVPLIDAIEGFNSRTILAKDNGKAIEFAQEYDLPFIGGSDAHYDNEIGLGGIISDSDDIRDAIIKSDLQLFGKRSSIMNHVRTKIRKLWGKIAK